MFYYWIQRTVEPRSPGSQVGVQQLAKLSEADKSLQLPDGLVRSSTTVKNLGVVIDE